MAMSIGDRYLSGTTNVNRAESSANVSTNAVQRKPGADGGRGDEVQLSNLALHLSADSPERAARIARITAEVQSGRYEVDAAEVSRRMIAGAIEEP